MHNGILTCALYAYAPNLLSYCGPDKKKDLTAYITRIADPDAGLIDILDKFETLYPYLRLIASENKISDPFDTKVVEAYFLGNSLLSHISVKSLMIHLTDTMKVTGKISKKVDADNLIRTNIKGLPYHNHHVLNIFRFLPHASIPQAISTIDNCRISWGEVIYVKDSGVSVKIRPVKLNKQNRFILGEPTVKTIINDHLKLKPKDIVSVHWGRVCEKLNPVKIRNLAYFTNLAIVRANGERI